MSLPSTLPVRVSLFGTGNLMSALLSGWQKAGLLGTQINAIGVNRSEANVKKARDRFGIEALCLEEALAQPERAVWQSDLWILGVKPWQLQDLLVALNPMAQQAQAPVFSLAAGVKLDTMAAALPEGLPLGRIMGNTQWTVASGVGVWCANSAMEALEPNALMEALLKPVGLCLKSDETYFDALTAFVGSSPAFGLTFIEALADGAVNAGLPRYLASALAPALIQGVARQVQETGAHPAQLRDQITTPGGTTMAGLMTLEAAGFRHAVAEAVSNAAKRAAQLR